MFDDSRPLQLLLEIVMLTNDFQDTTHKLREIAVKYEAMSTVERSAFRNGCYRKCGAFAKILLANKGKLLLDLAKEEEKQAS